MRIFILIITVVLSAAFCLLNLIGFRGVLTTTEFFMVNLLADVALAFVLGHFMYRTYANYRKAKKLQQELKQTQTDFSAHAASAQAPAHHAPQPSAPAQPAPQAPAHATPQAAPSQAPVQSPVAPQPAAPQPVVPQSPQEAPVDTAVRADDTALYKSPLVK